MINKTWRTYLDIFPSCEGIEIKKSKLQSISHIKYYIDDILTTQDSSTYYATEEDSYSSIYIKSTESWPDVDVRKQSIQITFVSGYGDDATYVPQALKEAMLSQLTFLYSNAGDCVDNGESQFKQMYFPFILPQMFLRIC